MIVIGADIHKSTHALAAVSGDGGAVAGEREIRADEAGHRAALRWARELDGERVWAIEDCRHLSRRLEQALIAAGERVVRVPPKMMGASRRGEREPGKSDQIDARAVARAVVREGVERFAAAFLDERALEIRLICDHRAGPGRRAHPADQPSALASGRSLSGARGEDPCPPARQRGDARPDRPSSSSWRAHSAHPHRP